MVVLIVTVGSWSLSKNFTRTLKLDRFFRAKESDRLYSLHKTLEISHCQELIRLHTKRSTKSVPILTSACQYLRSYFGANVVLLDNVLHFFLLQLCFKNSINKGCEHKKCGKCFWNVLYYNQPNKYSFSNTQVLNFRL